MIANIISNHKIALENITVWEEVILEARFSATNPRSRFIDNSQYQMWDGVYRRYRKGQGWIARPFLAELRSICKLKNLQLVVKDSRPPSKYAPIPIESITPDFLPGITLKDFQVDAIKCVYKTEVGIFDVATGGGKGELIAGICKAIPCPTTIVAEQRIVVEQIKRRLELRDVCDEPGLFYAGKVPSGQLIIIGTIQSLVVGKKPEEPKRSKFVDTGSSSGEHKYQLALQRYAKSLKAHKSRDRKAKIVRDLIGKCDMLIADEADLCTSDTHKKLYRYWFNGRRRYGMTGTPYDSAKPVQKLILQEHLGSVIYKQDKVQVQQAGLIVPLEYYAIVMDGNPKDARTFDIAVNEDIVYGDKLHRTIAALCAKHRDVGVLILVNRDDLGYALKNLIPDSEFIHGSTAKRDRPRILKAFESRQIKVLIGGKNVRRGMDLAGGCEVLILATGGKLKSEFDQALGRARRLNSEGKARVYDFYWLTNQYLYEHSRIHLKAAIEMGYPTFVVFTDGIVDGAAFVRSRFRKPNFTKGVNGARASK